MLRRRFWVGASLVAAACSGGGEARMGAPPLGGLTTASDTDAGSESSESTDTTGSDAPGSSGGAAASEDTSTSGTELCESAAFDFTGTEQALPLPAGARFLHVKAWGAGGNHDTNACENEDAATGAGGVGGYTEAVVPVSGGEIVKIVVGEYGNQGNSKAQGEAGFGGGRGGGFSGVFSGSDPLTEFDQARALVVAGGGGAAASVQCVAGIPGNHPDSGGQATMQGELADGAGGGGGYEGGSASSTDGSRGGTGFVTTSAVGQVTEWAEFGETLPPRTDDPDYADGAGTAERNGHVKVYVYCSEDEVPAIEG